MRCCGADMLVLTCCVLPLCDCRSLTSKLCYGYYLDTVTYANKQYSLRLYRQCGLDGDEWYIDKGRFAGEPCSRVYVHSARAASESACANCVHSCSPIIHTTLRHHSTAVPRFLAKHMQERLPARPHADSDASELLSVDSDGSLSDGGDDHRHFSGTLRHRDCLRVEDGEAPLCKWASHPADGR
jgi:hypothetical protein